MIIVIDPGHGGHDSGAVANGMKEKDITLDIGKRIRHIIQNEYEDVSLIMTRDTDIFHSLSERANIANKENADFFLSIHVNAGGGTGFESFVYTYASNKSIEIQHIVHSVIVDTIDRHDRGKKSKNLAVLRETKMPALLTENLFIDNKLDAELLKQEEYREKLAIAHVIGMEKALKLTRKTTDTGKQYRLKTGIFKDRIDAENAANWLKKEKGWVVYVDEA